MQFVLEPGKLTEQELRDELSAAVEVMRGRPGWGESVLILKGLPARDAVALREVDARGAGLRVALVDLVRDPAIKGAVAASAGLLLRGGLARIAARRERAG